MIFAEYDTVQKRTIKLFLPERTVFKPYGSPRTREEIGLKSKPAHSRDLSRE